MFDGGCDNEDGMEGPMQSTMVNCLNAVQCVGIQAAGRYSNAYVTCTYLYKRDVFGAYKTYNKGKSYKIHFLTEMRVNT